MSFLAVGAAIAAGLLNGLSAYFQRMAAGHPEARDLFSRKFIVTVARNRRWLLGAVLQLTSFASQAYALSSGSLAVVDPILTTDLLFLFLILRITGRIKPGFREWFGAVAICGGLGAFLVAAHPVGGHFSFRLVPWITMFGVFGILVGITIFAVRRMRSGKARAAIAGIVTGLSFALVSSLTKLVLVEYEGGGLARMFSNWQIYALIVIGIVALLLLQNTYGAGPLATSHPAFEIFDPLAGIAIAVFLFGDTFNRDLLHISIAAAGLALLIVGVVMVGGSHKLHPFHSGEDRDSGDGGSAAKRRARTQP